MLVNNQFKKRSFGYKNYLIFQIINIRNPDQEKKVQEFIESVLGIEFPANVAYEDVLYDGILLSKLMNKIKPNSIPTICEGDDKNQLEENVKNFQKALQEYGVPDIDVFQTIDLFEKRDIVKVTNTLFALGRAVWKDPSWHGPELGPRPLI